MGREFVIVLTSIVRELKKINKKLDAITPIKRVLTADEKKLVSDILEQLNAEAKKGMECHESL